MVLTDIDVDTDKLPKIPKVVQQLIQSLNNQDVDMADLATQISQDPVILAKVIRVANSPLYGGTRNISSANEAVVRLGLNTVRSIVLAAGFVSAFKSPVDFDLKAFWKNSFRVAALCKWLCSFSDVDADEAFTCGMMHSIGILAIHLLYPDKAGEIETLVSHGGERLHIEYSHLGFTHDDMASALAEHWNFPVVFQQALLVQSKPMDRQPLSQLAVIIFLAKMIDEGVEQGGENAQIVFALSPLALVQLGIAPELLQEKLDIARGLITASSVFID
ncbi:MAG: HDOD domain-containing protein [Pseudomonadales bacterium]|nr:HDOD domain-containing protein [Pseudomonadales bacterium]